MGTNQGFNNEYGIIEAIHGKKIGELPYHFRSWIEMLFGKTDDVLIGKKLNNEQKADMVIKCGDKSKYISIKSGDLNTYHAEPIQLFIPFLRSIGVSEKTLKTIVFFHYGDNTFDGSGPMRFTSAELRKTYPKIFKEASEELSQSNILNPVIERCILKGRFDNNHLIDGIYHGTAEGGFFISTKQIKAILLRKTHRRKNGTINLIMLSYQPGSRNLWGIPGSEQKRNQVEIKWRSFIKDALDQVRYDKMEDLS